MSKLRRMLFRRHGGDVPFEYFVRDDASARVLVGVLDEAAMERWSPAEPDGDNPLDNAEERLACVKESYAELQCEADVNRREVEHLLKQRERIYDAARLLCGMGR